jgi:hypothetical protein
MSAASRDQELENEFSRFRIRQLKIQIVSLQLWLTLNSVLFPIAGIVILYFYCDGATQAFWASTMVGVGIMIVGGLLGLLFAIPRAQDPDKLDGLPQRRRPFIVNTNFEQISDWLTKIIVGVTLVQLDEIVTKLGHVIDDIAGIFGNQTGATLVAAGIVSYFSAVGFLIGYVATRSLITMLLGWIEGTLSEVLEEGK